MYERVHLTAEQVDGVYREALQRLEMEALLGHVNALMAVDETKRNGFAAENALARTQIDQVTADRARVLFPPGQEEG